ncbi:MAG: ABC transporter ATP-binding protein [Comamonadaceae bacterium]|nr:ABC transporter ATP-binding protein [Comamonadaceae bacterium]
MSVHPALELRSLHKRFGQTEVIRGLSLSVQAGERIGIIGPNGAGKSTLFDLISGRQVPSSGQVWLDRQRIDAKAPFQVNRLGLARSFQTSSLFPSLSMFDNLRCALLWQLGGRYSPFKWLSGLGEANARVEQLLEQLQLGARRNTLAAQLSYAEQRALELGITLASGAPVILLDEPTAGMSRTEAAGFVQLIRSVTVGKTLLIVEHDMPVVFGLADKMAVLVQGELLAFDTPDRVRADAQVQAAYLGQRSLAKRQ